MRLLPEGEIKFKLLENHWVQITSDRRTYKMVGMAKDNFPAVPAFPHPLVKIPAKILSSLIAKTAFAISMEESRYTLNGALLILKPDTIDHGGHRRPSPGRRGDRSHFRGAFQRSAHPGPQESHDRNPAPCRAKPAKTARSNSRATKAIYFSRWATRLLISRILTGQFPNYEAVLPRDNNKTIVLERDEFNDAVRRVSQLADQRSHAVKFSVSPEGVELSASSPEYGEAKETIEKEYKGEPLSIGFNGQYLLDFLAAAADGPISVELKDEQSAGQLRPLADEQYRYRYVIMPMRI